MQMFWRARNSTIRRGELGRPPAASTPHATISTATLLSNGKVLVVGGLFSPGFRLARERGVELYDPAKGVWTATGSLNTARLVHTATLLPNGMVLGGSGRLAYRRFGERGTLRSGERYLDGDREASRTARSSPTATLLPNGMGISVAGGLEINNTPSASAELYDSGQGGLDGHRQPQYRTR